MLPAWHSTLGRLRRLFLPTRVLSAAPAARHTCAPSSYLLMEDAVFNAASAELPRQWCRNTLLIWITQVIELTPSNALSSASVPTRWLPRRSTAVKVLCLCRRSTSFCWTCQLPQWGRDWSTSSAPDSSPTSYRTCLGSFFALKYYSFGFKLVSKTN